MLSSPLMTADEVQGLFDAVNAPRKPEAKAASASE